MLGGAVDYYFTPHLGVTTGFGGHLRHVQQYQDGERLDAFFRETTLMVPLGLVGNWSLSPKSRILVEMGGIASRTKSRRKYDPAVNPDQQDNSSINSNFNFFCSLGYERQFGEVFGRIGFDIIGMEIEEYFWINNTPIFLAYPQAIFPTISVGKYLDASPKE